MAACCLSPSFVFSHLLHFAPHIITFTNTCPRNPPFYISLFSCCLSFHLSILSFVYILLFNRLSSILLFLQPFHECHGYSLVSRLFLLYFLFLRTSLGYLYMASYLRSTSLYKMRCVCVPANLLLFMCIGCYSMPSYLGSIPLYK